MQWLLTSSFRFNRQKEPERWTAPIIIKDHVKIGSRVIIQPDVTIGENSIITAGTIVNSKVSANTIINSH